MLITATEVPSYYTRNQTPTNAAWGPTPAITRPLQVILPPSNTPTSITLDAYAHITRPDLLCLYQFRPIYQTFTTRNSPTGSIVI